MPALFIITADPMLFLDRDGRWRSEIDPRASPAQFDEREEAEQFARAFAQGKTWHITIRKV